MANAEQAKGYVTKSFVIDIITRDLNILDAILELVDNSLDRAVELYQIDVTRGLTQEYSYSAQHPELTEGLTVSIAISNDALSIEDNCGGITRTDVENEIFVFGNPKEETHYTGLSAFGIGMKRAFFKLGRMVVMRTRHKGEESAVSWDIDNWVGLGDEEQSWRVPLAGPETIGVSYQYQSDGTVIRVSRLNSVVQSRLMQPEFIVALKERLQTSYALFLKSGFKLFLNGEQLTHTLPSFFTSDELNYTSKALKVDDVDIQIVLGISPLKDRVPRGWYIFCNGRMVLQADKTETSGWGAPLPAFHPKWNHFLGFVSFTSSNVKALPWSSTKWGIDRDSRVYAFTLEEMRVQALPVLNLLDRWKDATDDEEPAIALSDLLKGGIERPIFASAEHDQVFEYKPNKPKPDIVRVTFKKERTLVEKVKEALGNPNMPNSSMGERVFDYFAEREL